MESQSVVVGNSYQSMMTGVMYDSPLTLYRVKPALIGNPCQSP